MGGAAFEVRCLHIPVHDQTPFELQIVVVIQYSMCKSNGLVKFVEQTVRLEHASSPNKPIYLVGDYFGGCLALAVAARNPSIDLVLILVNLGDPMKMAMDNIDSKLPSRQRLEQMSSNLTALLPLLSCSVDDDPEDNLEDRLFLLLLVVVVSLNSPAATGRRNGSSSTFVGRFDHFPENIADTLPYTSLIPPSTAFKRQYRNFTSIHPLTFEDGISLLTIIKGTSKYRRSRKLDPVSDFLPPSMTEFKYAFDQVVRLLRFATSSVMLSTLEDGKIVKGLLVGYQMLMGLELYSLIEEFLREKNVMVGGIAHPTLFSGKHEGSFTEFFTNDWIKVKGGVPVSAKNLYKLFSTKSHVLPYPGGACEALHYKQEFVRMAARFGVTIVPFGAVGEDDIAELVLDYENLMKIPVLNDFIKENNHDINLRDEISGEVANQRLFIPGLLPKAVFFLLWSFVLGLCFACLGCSVLAVGFVVLLVFSWPLWLS
ncbi:hypothetical protein EZV62_007096 [Acer yangbiense]|uniref:Acyltransferase n=1 Tax=Acer yangbiense TaxID=1000413 RepID=A0A5C7I9K8_9ROSI|nr:hypothetical protein EZV62_007096 [Acer yangbiense]